MSGTRFIVAGNLIDGSGSEVQKNVFMSVKDSIITAIDSTENLPRNEGAAIDDFSHCTIVPALVDCSVCLSLSPSVDSMVRVSAKEADFAKKAAMLEKHMSYCHAHGVLGVADTDDTNGLVKRYQEEVEKESVMNIRTSSLDFLKIEYSTNIEDEKTSNLGLTFEDLCHIVLHKGEKKAVVVANGAQKVAQALEAGCDAIEQGYGMGEDNLRKMVDKDVLWIPSVLRARNALDSSGSGEVIGCRFSTRYVAQGKAVPGAEMFWKKMFAEQMAQLHLAQKLGVKTAVGSGAGSIGILHGESMVEEMKLFIKAGYTLVETIRCATENGAQFFGFEKLGALTVGQNATFLVARGTVQQLPRKLSYLESIYVNGAPSITYQKNPVRT